MTSCKAVLKTSSWQPAPFQPTHRKVPCTAIGYFLETMPTCCVIRLSTLASNTKHNQYHRGHNTMKDKEEASIACWYRNLKGIRYCPLIMAANHG